MEQQQQSGLRIYSLGIVANNKEMGSNTIEVVPIETTPFMDGEIASMPYDAEASGKDAQGNSFNVKVTADQAIQAHWIRQQASNRITAPDVRRGMRVLIWQFADDNKYYWTDAGMDSHMMKLETVVFQISATKDEDADSTAVENSYYLEMSSHNKMITLGTSKANEEFCGYVVQMNLAEGRIVITDDIGNDITLDSKETIISAENAEGTIFALEKRNIVGYAPDHINLVAEQQMNFSCREFTLQCETGKINASSSFTLTTPTFNAQCDNTTFSGNVKLDSQLTVQGASRFQTRIQAAGMTSSASIVGPSNTI